MFNGSNELIIKECFKLWKVRDRDVNGCWTTSLTGRHKYEMNTYIATQ